jgi:uroporphyrinogen-III synthase
MTAAPSLRGTRVAILEARKGTELASLVERSSGISYCVPAVREVERDCKDEVARAISWLGEGERRLVVLLNGAGVNALFRVAAELGREKELHDGFARSELLCRGPKPIAALKARGLTATVRVDEPYTTREVLLAFDDIALRGRGALVVHHGERNDAVVMALTRAHVKVIELSLYVWDLPEDLAPLIGLIDEIVERRVGAVAFTTQIQARHLVEVADRVRKKKELVLALNTHTLAAAIGPTCAEMLRELGIPPRVVPPKSSMGSLVRSLAQFLTEEGA